MKFNQMKKHSEGQTQSVCKPKAAQGPPARNRLFCATLSF